MELKPGDKVTFMHYGELRHGRIDRIGKGGIAWLVGGRWMHLESLTLDKN